MIYVIFILPILLVLSGFLMFKYPPRKINYFIGYRTFKSMKNENVWKVANYYCGKLWVKIGIIMFFIALLLVILVWFKLIKFTEDILVITVFGEICAMLSSVWIVERKLKNMNDNLL